MTRYIATIEATHAGFVNDNNVLYPETDVNVATESWTKPYLRPLCVHHELGKDAIGRIISAEYVPIAPLGDNAPKGFIRLKAHIGDLDAVQKIKDRIYSTVSIRASASKVSCGICEQDIVKDGLCEHVRGKSYEGKKAFWKVGGLSYTECSPVNQPADVFAQIVSLEEVPTMGLDSKDGKTTLKYTFVDDDNDDVEEKWDNYTEEDLAMALWLVVEMDKELGDATLSAEQRKKLSAKTFCGPNRSFPVPDCKHVVAARRLIGRYKGPGDKTKILACVNRKAKQLGCDGGKDSNTGDEMSTSLNELLERQDLREHIDAKLADQKKTLDVQLNTQIEAARVLTEKVKTLEASDAQKTQEIETQKTQIKTLEEKNNVLTEKIHQGLVDKVFDRQKELQLKVITDLTDEAKVTAYKAELAKRKDESLQDSLNDMEKEITGKIQKKITNSAPDEVKDAQVSRAEKIKKAIFG